MFSVCRNDVDLPLGGVLRNLLHFLQFLLKELFSCSCHKVTFTYWVIDTGHVCISQTNINEFSWAFETVNFVFAKVSCFS